MVKMNNFFHTLQSIYLCLRFPFLYPRNYRTDKPVHIIPTYTLLDSMDIGWRKAFGIKICKEIKRVLRKNKQLKQYRVGQIKEKFGGLRWYDNSDLTHDIINKYENISYHTCIVCGKKAQWSTPYSMWKRPYCDTHVPKNISKDLLEKVE